MTDSRPGPGGTHWTAPFRRVVNRVVFMATALAGGGALIGHYAFRVMGRDALAGWILGAAIGALLGVYNGVMGGILAWFFPDPVRGARRTGLLFGIGMGSLMLVLLLGQARGWPDVRNASLVGLEGAALGGAAGAILGAFLGWIAGPIFRGMVVDMDARSFGAHRLQDQDHDETED